MCVYVQVQGDPGKDSTTGCVQLCEPKKVQEMRALVSEQSAMKGAVHLSRERLVGRLTHYTPSLEEIRECWQWASWLPSAKFCPHNHGQTATARTLKTGPKSLHSVPL